MAGLASKNINNLWEVRGVSSFPDITELEMALEAEENPMFFFDLKMDQLPPPLLALSDLDIMSSAPTSPSSSFLADESSPQTSCVSSPTSSRFQSRVNSPEPDLIRVSNLAELQNFLEFGMNDATPTDMPTKFHAAGLALLHEQEDQTSESLEQDDQEFLQLLQQQQQQPTATVAKRNKQRRGRLSRDGSTQPKRFAKRDSHNMSERQRRLDLKQNFAELQANIPNISDGRRVHTATILKEAIDLILELQREDEQLQAALQAARAGTTPSVSSATPTTTATPATTAESSSAMTTTTA